MATYENMQKLIVRDKSTNSLNKEVWISKLDVFLLFDRITTQEYQELIKLINA